MKKNLLLLLFCLPVWLIAQTGAVQLKDATSAPLGSFSTIAAAYAAIPATVTQAYIIELNSDYDGSGETAPVTLGLKAGTSASNTITIRPAATVTTNITLSKAASGSSIFTVDDADYLIIDGRPGGAGVSRLFTIANTATNSSSNTVQFINGATNNIVRNCIINNGTVGNAGRNVFFGTSPANATGNSDNLIALCTINSGRYAINNNGTSGNLNSRNKIYGCDVNTIRFVGLWVQSNCAKTYIDSCSLYCTSNSGDSPYGILGDAVSDSLVITRNKIYDLNAGTTSTTIKGINVRSVTGTNYLVVENNFIALGGSAAPNPGSTNMVGIDFTMAAGTATNIFVNNNTVRIMSNQTSNGTSGNVVSSCLNVASSVSNASNNVSVYNNIFINERAGGVSGVQHVGMSLIASGGTYRLNNNTFNASSGNYVRLGSTVYTSIAAYQAAIGSVNETNANNIAVQLVSETDLHLTGSSLGNTGLAALPVNTILVDIDNQARSATSPYRGADESTISLPLKLLSISLKKQTSDAIINWRTADEVNNYGFYIERSTDGQRFSNAGFVAATTYPQSVNAYVFSDKNILANWPGSRIFYRIKQVDKDGRFTYSGILYLQLDKTGFTASIYPNPVKEVLQLRINLTKSANVEVSIIDVGGRTILAKKIAVGEGVNSIRLLESATLQPGHYFAKVVADTKQEIVPFIKQ